MKVDNPWGLVILFAAFMIQGITFGISFVFGLFIVELLQQFDTSIAFLSFIGSANVGLFLGAGPIASYMMRKMSYRKVALLGGVLSSVGLICTPFSPNLEFMLVFYGVVAGFGFCLLYIPSHVLSGLYYDKHRSLATGVVTAGSTVGGIIFAIVVPLLIESYGWRGSFLLLAGINLHNIVLAGLLRAAPMQIDNKNEELLISVKEDTDLVVNGENDIIVKKENGASIKKTEDDDVNEPEKVENGTTETTTMIKSNDIKKRKSSTVKPRKSHLRLIWTNFDFVIYFVNNFLWNMGASIIYILCPEYFTKIGFSLSDAGVLISMTSIGGCIGCFLGGIVGNILHNNRMALYTVTNIGFGILCFFLQFSFIHTFVGISILSILIGLILGIILGLLVVVTADIVGPDALGDAMGYLMLANGLGNIIGPPFGGLLIKWTGSIDSFILFGGTANVLSGVLMLAIPVANKFKGYKAKKEETEAGIQSGFKDI